MTTTTGTGLDALRARYGEAFGTRLPDHIRRLPGTPDGWPGTSATDCVPCWPARSSAPRFMPGAWAASTRGVSSSMIWPACR